MEKMVGEDFDQLVRFFDGMATTSWLTSIHDQLKAATGSWQGQEVLDVGCGTGRLLLKGAAEATHVTGIDLSKEMINASSQLFHTEGLSKKARFLVADAYELPFLNEQFDLALSTCVLFLLPEPARAMEEMLRIIKKSGQIVMLNPSLKMSKEEAANYCANNKITGFEEKTLLQWATISTSRHRYSTEELTDYFLNKGAKSVENSKVLNELAIITVVKFEGSKKAK